MTKLQMNIEATGVTYTRKYNTHSKLLMESLKGRDHLGTPLPIGDMTPVRSTAFFGQAKQSSMLWDLSITSIPTMSSLWSGKMTEKMQSSPTVTCHNYKVC
jgi:hypothetical protein